MTAPAVTVNLRIPGQWEHPRELVQRMPQGCKLKPDSLTLPDGQQFEIDFLPPDDQFAGVFASACRRNPTAAERAAIEGYKVNAVVTGPGGSMQAALGIMQAGAAIVRAGGAGVFIDNSALSHGGEGWLEMADDGSPDAVSFAFVSIIRGEAEVFTMGFHVLGLRDVLMKRTDIEVEGFDIVEVIRYLAQGDKPVDDGHIIADENGPRFRAVAISNDDEVARSVLRNPYGRLKLVSLRDIAEIN